MRQDVHSPGFIGRAPQPSPRCRGRFSSGTCKCEESDARRQGPSGALSFDKEDSGALEHSSVAPEDNRFVTACYGREAE